MQRTGGPKWYLLNDVVIPSQFVLRSVGCMNTITIQRLIWPPNWHSDCQLPIELSGPVLEPHNPLFLGDHRCR